MQPPYRPLSAIVAIALPVLAQQPEEARVDYMRQVRPILTQHCYACHGPDERERETELRFDQRKSVLAELEYGLPALTPGKPDKSEMWLRITTDDEDDVMPPPKAMTGERTGDPTIETRIQSYEMAARMQASVPELADLSKEPKDVLERYGAEPGKKSFAANCLLARRLAERNVRFIQVCDGGWDHHGNLPRALPKKCRTIDKPIAALLTDLEERGLLDDTIVMMMGEFGRAPICEGGLSHDRYGRDHNGRVGSAIIAGGGFRKGLTYGATDDWGWRVAQDPVHIHDLQATVLHQLGLDHEKLVVRHQGRDFRLTDVGGKVVRGIIQS